MKADKGERRAGLAGNGVRAVGAMVKKLLQEGGRFATIWTGRFRPANACIGYGAKHGSSGIVVKLKIFLRPAMPVVDVGLVPDLPEPGFDGIVPIAFAQVLGELKNQFAPLDR